MGHGLGGGRLFGEKGDLRRGPQVNLFLWRRGPQVNGGASPNLNSTCIIGLGFKLLFNFFSFALLHLTLAL